MRLPLFSLTMATLCGLAMVQFGGLLGRERRQAPKPRFIAVDSGAKIRLTVTGLDAPVAISALAPGSCKYVILATPACGASVTAARQWRQLLRSEQAPRLVPRLWTVVWVSLGEDPVADSAFAVASDVRVVHATDPAAVIEELGIRAYPVHLILDRQGRVVDSDVGARLLPLESYRPDCSVRSDATSS